jgi:hypothetical protein
MCNQLIRNEARACGVKLWQIADAIGINDGNLSRKLRRELPEEERERIIGIIHSIRDGGATNAAG